MTWKTTGWLLLGSLCFTLAAPPYDLHLLSFVAFVPVFHAFNRLGLLAAFVSGQLLGSLLFLFATPWWPQVIQNYTHLKFLPASAIWLGLWL